MKTKECIGIIYFTVCLLDGMGYVGFHHTSANDDYFGSGLIITRHIKKHGKEHLRRIIIDHYCTLEERTEKETKWIAKFDLLNRKIGYNIHKGGTGGDTLSKHPNREEIGIKISVANKGKRCGEKNGMYNNTHTPKIKSFLSNHSKEQWKNMSKKERKYMTQRLKVNATKYKYKWKNEITNEWIDIIDLKVFCEENNLNYNACHNGIRYRNKYKNIKFKRYDI